MHRAEVDLDQLVERRVGSPSERNMPAPSCSARELDELLRPPGLLEVAKRLRSTGKSALVAAVLGHMFETVALGDGERGEAVAGELDELVHDALLAEELGEREHEVGRGCADRGADP